MEAEKVLDNSYYIIVYLSDCQALSIQHLYYYEKIHIDMNDTLMNSM